MLDFAKEFYKSHRREIHLVATTAISIAIPAVLGLPLLPLIRGVFLGAVIESVMTSLLKKYVLLPIKEELATKSTEWKNKFEDVYNFKENSVEEFKKFLASKEKEGLDSLQPNLANLINDRIGNELRAVANTVMNNAVKNKLIEIVDSNDLKQIKAKVDELEKLNPKNHLPVGLRSRVLEMVEMKRIFQDEKFTLTIARTKLLDALVTRADKNNLGVPLTLKMIDILNDFNGNIELAHDIVMKNLNVLSAHNIQLTEGDIENQETLHEKFSKLLDIRLKEIEGKDRALYNLVEKYYDVGYEEIQSYKQSVDKFVQYDGFAQAARQISSFFLFNGAFASISKAVGCTTLKVLGADMVIFQGLKSLPGILLSSYFLKTVETCCRHLSSLVCPRHIETNIIKDTVIDSTATVLFGMDKFAFGLDLNNKTLPVIAKKFISQGAASKVVNTAIETVKELFSSDKAPEQQAAR